MVESVILMIVIAIWVSYSLSKLITIEKTALVERHTGFKTSSLLSEICYQAFGKWGSYVLEATVSLTMLGVGVVYVTTSADLISHLPWDKAGSDFLYQNKAMFVLFIGRVMRRERAAVWEPAPAIPRAKPGANTQCPWPAYPGYWTRRFRAFRPNRRR